MHVTPTSFNELLQWPFSKGPFSAYPSYGLFWKGKLGKRLFPKKPYSTTSTLQAMKVLKLPTETNELSSLILMSCPSRSRYNVTCCMLLIN